MRINGEKKKTQEMNIKKRQLVIRRAQHEKKTEREKNLKKQTWRMKVIHTTVIKKKVCRNKV